MSISLEPFDLQSAEEMVSLFSSDEILRKELGLNTTEFSAEDEFEFVMDWSRKKNAEQFAIRYGDELAGMISLSHIDLENKSARTGYWIGSEFRNKRICTEAFRLILGLAKSKGIEVLESDIDKDNISSLKIWEKYKPEITEKSEKQVSVKMNISPSYSIQSVSN